MLLTEIDHVAIAVKDLEAAIDYYARAFGATVEHREIVESDGVEEALLKVAESYIQLLTPTRALRSRRWSPPAPRRSTKHRARAAAARPSRSCTRRAASAR